MNFAEDVKDLFNRYKFFFYTIGFALFLYFIQWYLFTLGIFTAFPNQTNLLAWDTGFYHSIAQNNYQLDSRNTAFYPLFSLMWKLSSLNAFGISIVNILLFAMSVQLLSKVYSFTDEKFFLWLSFPSSLFFFVAYTESLFMICSVGLLYGLRFKRAWIIVTMIFLLSLTRATGIVLLPALTIMLWLTHREQRMMDKIKTAFLQYFLPVVLATSLFIYYQYRLTGIWFVYFKQQSEFWDRTLNWVKFPLQIYNGDRVVLVNSLALFLSILAIGYLIRYAYLFIKRKVEYDPLVVFSVAVIVFTFFSNLFFAPRWNTEHTSSLIGLHRYLFSTVFSFIFISSIKIRPDLKSIALIIVLSILVSLSFGSYKHITTFLFYSLSTLYLMIYFVADAFSSKWAILLLCMFNFILQSVFFQMFITGTFVE